MKNILSILFVLFLSQSLLAQAPLGFNYQGIAREADGTPIANQEIAIRVNIIDGPQGSSQYEEAHFLTTNAFGLFTAIIGQGNGNSTLNSVNWAAGNLWLQIELDPDDSGNYILMGAQQLMSVPYALFAQESGAGLAAGSGISINNGKINNIAPDRPITLIEGANVTIDNDYPNFTISTTNEVQDLQLTGNNLTITNNGTATTIDLSPYLDNTDTQLTEAEVDAFANNNGYLTTEVDGSTTNEIQNLNSSVSGTNRTIGISGGTGTTISVADNDNSTSNETITSISYIANNTLRFVEGGVNNDISIGTLNADLDANNNTIVNIADPVNPQDAVNLQYLEAKDATDYAISVPITNTSSGAAGDILLDLTGASLDKGNLISGSTITITEAGVYSVSVQGFSQTAVGSDIDILINGVPTAVLRGTNNYVGSYLFELAATNTVEIMVKYGATVEIINLQISIYKI